MTDSEVDPLHIVPESIKLGSKQFVLLFNAQTLTNITGKKKKKRIKAPVSVLFMSTFA